MAQFLNQKVDPKAKASAKSESATGTNETRVAWGNATDQGVSASERITNQTKALEPAVSAGQSFIAGAQNSIIAAAVRKASAPDFTADPDFDVKTVMPTDPAMKLYKPNSEEIEWLHGAKSVEEYQYRTQEMLEQRDRATAMGENMVSGIAGSLVGDAPLMLLPMGAAGVAGRTGLAVRSAIRAADVGSAIYAADQPGQSNTVAGIVAAVSGIDQLWDMARVARAVRASDPVERQVARAVRQADTSTDAAVDAARPRFDPDAPTKRTAPDTEVRRNSTGQGSIGKGTAEKAAAPSIKESPLSPEFYATKLKAPIKVANGEIASVNTTGGILVKHLLNSEHLDEAQKLLVASLKDKVDSLPVRLTGNTTQRSNFSYKASGPRAADLLTMRASPSQAGKTWNTVGDAFNALDQHTAKIAAHELIHAATTHALRSTDAVAQQARADIQHILNQVSRRGDAPKEARYYAQNVDEALAGLGDSRDWVNYLNSVKLGDKTLLRQIGAAVMRALGFADSDTALAKMLDSYEKLLQVGTAERSAELFRSNALSQIERGVVNEANPAVRNDKLLSGMKAALKQSFALYDNIAAGNKELADLLVSDGAAVGARKPAVADFKRNLTLEMDGAASVVEDAVLAQLKQQGVTMMDRFFQRSRFKEARTALEDKFAKYLDLAYDAEINGRTVPTPDAEIAPLVQAYRESGWATRWHDHMTASGLIEEGSFPKSEFYFPRQYSYDKMRQGILDMKAQGMDEARALETYRGLFRAALRDVAPEIDSQVANRVATEMLNGIYHGRANQPGAAWRSLVPGISNDELVDKLYRAGMDEEAVQRFVRGNIAPDRGSSPVKNVRSRTRFNMTREYVVNGQSLRMQDLMDTDVAKVMHGYTNRMSGRVGFAYAGIKDFRNLAKTIDESKHALPDPQRWGKTVDDTIDYMLGGVVGSETPELLRAAGNLANATMLKNSGLYQITDTALAMKDYGMTKVFRSMSQQPWFKEGQVVLKDKSLSTRLDSILRGSIQKEMRFRWLNTYADDNLDLTRSSQWFNVTQNLGQAARHVNGMSMVHRMQVNVNAGLVMDDITEMLKGSADAATRLEKYGLSHDIMDEARAAYAANPDAMLPPHLQIQVEVAGARMMDYLVQQIRTGETSYFAQLNPVGRVIVGYQSFAMAATNKILRRTLNDTGPLGLMHLMAYQFPLMLLATQAKYSMDGKSNKTTKDLIMDSVLGMSAIGGLSLIQPLFSGDTPRHSLASMGYVASSLGALQDIAAGKADAESLSKVLPLVQEFAPTRAIINNFGDE